MDVNTHGSDVVLIDADGVRQSSSEDVDDDLDNFMLEGPEVVEGGPKICKRKERDFYDEGESSSEDEGMEHFLSSTGERQTHKRPKLQLPNPHLGLPLQASSPTKSKTFKAPSMIYEVRGENMEVSLLSMRDVLKYGSSDAITAADPDTPALGPVDRPHIKMMRGGSLGGTSSGSSGGGLHSFFTHDAVITPGSFRTLDKPHLLTPLGTESLNIAKKVLSVMRLGYDEDRDVFSFQTLKSFRRPDEPKEDHSMSELDLCERTEDETVLSLSPIPILPEASPMSVSPVKKHSPQGGRYPLNSHFAMLKDLLATLKKRVIQDKRNEANADDSDDAEEYNDEQSTSFSGRPVSIVPTSLNDSDVCVVNDSRSATYGSLNFLRKRLLTFNDVTLSPSRLVFFAEDSFLGGRPEDAEETVDFVEPCSPLPHETFPSSPSSTAPRPQINHTGRRQCNRLEWLLTVVALKIQKDSAVTLLRSAEIDYEGFLEVLKDDSDPSAWSDRQRKIFGGLYGECVEKMSAGAELFSLLIECLSHLPTTCLINKRIYVSRSADEFFAIKSVKNTTENRPTTVLDRIEQRADIVLGCYASEASMGRECDAKVFSMQSSADEAVSQPVFEGLGEGEKVSAFFYVLCQEFELRTVCVLYLP